MFDKQTQPSSDPESQENEWLTGKKRGIATRGRCKTIHFCDRMAKLVFSTTS